MDEYTGKQLGQPWTLISMIEYILIRCNPTDDKYKQ